MFHRFTLKNGIQVVSEPMENRRTVAMGVFVKVGSRNETKADNGISHLMEHMLFKGTTHHTAKEIADITARMGDDINAFTSKECTALYGMTITENLREMAMLMGEMLTNSVFDAKELAKEKRVVMDEIDMYEDSAEDLVHELLQKRIWRDSALGFQISGNKSVVRGFHKAQLEAFHREHYFAENLLISVAGGYDEEKLLGWLAEAFSDMRKRAGGPQIVADSIKAGMGSALALEPYHKQYKTKQETAGGKSVDSPEYYRSFATADKDIEQLHMNLAFPALKVGDERRFAYSVFNSAFGGSNNSWLFQKIREDAGLAYSVYSYSSAYERAGLFHIDITMQPALGVPVLEKVIGVARDFACIGLKEEELAMHKQQVRTELIMNSESPKNRMDANAKYALAGTPLYTVEEKLAKIDAITCEDIRMLAREIMDLSQCSMCVVGDKSCMDLRGIKKKWEQLCN